MEEVEEEAEVDAEEDKQSEIKVVQSDARSSTQPKVNNDAHFVVR